MKMNCWEAKACGRAPGGVKAVELGVCPAALHSAYDDVNGGKNGGRICWMVAGTLCGGKRQGVFAQKQLTCLACDFFLRVKREEGEDFKLKL